MKPNSNLQILSNILEENSAFFNTYKDCLESIDRLFFIAQHVRSVENKSSTLTRMLDETQMTNNNQVTMVSQNSGVGGCFGECFGVENRFGINGVGIDDGAGFEDFGPKNPDFVETDTNLEEFTIVEKVGENSSFRKTFNPLKMDMLPASIIPEKCRIFTSNAMPVSICYFHESNIYSRILLKSDPYSDTTAIEDVAQDGLISNLITIIDKLWLKNGLDLKVASYSCLPLGNDQGVIEIIGDGVAKSLREIQGVSGTYSDVGIHDFLEGETERLNQFVLSCAGCCVISYVLGLGDRHNDNVLLTRDGRLFHVDFGNAFGRWKKIGMLKRDRTPFLLTGDMYYVIKKVKKFDLFVELCQQAFQILRSEFLTIYYYLKGMMFHPGLHDLDENSINFVSEKLSLDKTNAEANSIFEGLVMTSLNDSFTRINFLAHSISQAIVISSAGLRSNKTSKLQAEDDLENSKEKSVIEKSVVNRKNTSKINRTEWGSSFKSKNEKNQLGDNKIMVTLDVKEGEIFVYVHKMEFNEVTRKTCTSVVVKIFDVENDGIKPGWSKSKGILVQEAGIQVRECLKISVAGEMKLENLTLQILENSSWISGKTSLFMVSLGRIAMENAGCGESGNNGFLYRHWVHL
jgi:hypothetical protein